MIRAVVLALVVLLGLQAGLPAPERAIAAYVDAHNGEALVLLERVVNINSGTQNVAGVREVGAIFRASLDALGFRTHWVEGAAFARAGHLVAIHPGRGPKILLVGHLDTVFERDSPFQKFKRLDATSATGPGIIDIEGRRRDHRPGARGTGCGRGVAGRGRHRRHDRRRRGWRAAAGEVA